MPNVSLTAPGAVGVNGLPAEQAASLQQLQIQQQLAEALLGKSLQQQDPIIHTGGNNPFARDVPNFAGPIGQLVNAISGKRMLDQVSPKITDLYRQSESLRQQDIGDVMKTYRGYDTPGPYEGGFKHTPGDIKAAVDVALRSHSPAVQAWGQEMQKGIIEAEIKSAFTPDSAGTQGRNFSPESIADSLFRDPSSLGTRQNMAMLRERNKVDASNGAFTSITPRFRDTPAQVQFMGRNPVGTGLTVAPGQTIPQDTTGIPGTLPNPPGLGGANVVTSPVASQAAPTGVDQPLPSLPTRPGGYTADEMAIFDARRAEHRANEQAGVPGYDSGVVPPLTGELAKADAAVTPGVGGAAPAAVPGPAGHVNTTQGDLHIDPSGKVSMLDSPVTKASAEMGTEAAKALEPGLAQRLKDQQAVSQISDVMRLARMRAYQGVTAKYQLLAKQIALDLHLTEDEAGKISASQTADARLLQIAALKTHAINSRPAQKFLEQEQEAAGIGRNVDARHVLDAGGGMIADLMNERDQWNNVLVPAHAKTAVGDRAYNYAHRWPDPEFPGIPEVKIVKDKNGNWVNQGITTPRAAIREGDSTATQKDFSGMTDEDISRELGIPSGR